jgi:hypothetical protein
MHRSILALACFVGTTTLLPCACRPTAAPTAAAETRYSAEVPDPISRTTTLLEAETAETTGTISVASTTLHTPGAEASGRRYVSLEPGQRVTWRAPVAFDSLVVRFSYPDAPGGGGLDGTLAVDADGVGRSLPVSSRYTWDYGAPKWGTTNVWTSDPQAGSPRHYWDEASLRLPSSFAAGAPVSMTNPADSGRVVLIDFLELDSVPPPVVAPAGSLSFADFEPAADGKTDDSPKLALAMTQAKAQGRVLYIPEGTYAIGAIELEEGTIQGGGLWRTRFVGSAAQFRFGGGRIRVADFAIFGETAVRNDHSDVGNAFAGRPGPGSVIERIWVEHMKCAFWVANANADRGPTGLRISGCRFRDLMADAVNLCNGTTDTTVDNCDVRNSGDDGLAAWSPEGETPAGGHNTFAFNTIQSPWVASGISLYGGGPFRVIGNTIRDTVTTGSGIFVAAAFRSHSFRGLIDVRDNILVRCGAHESDVGSPAGAIRILALDRDITGADLVFQNNRVVSPLESAVSIHGPRTIENLHLADLTVEDAPWVTDVRAGARGSATFRGVKVVGTNPERWRNLANEAFVVTR